MEARGPKRPHEGVASPGKMRKVTSGRELYREEFYTYRPTTKLIDVTIRDGGLMNKWQFSDELVRSVYRANIAAGVDYMEIGYFTSESYFKRGEVGPWRFCAHDDLQRIMGKNDTPLKISAMADIGRIDDEDIPPASESLIDLVRVACYEHQMDEAIRLANLCVERGYEVSINLMAVAKVPVQRIDECLRQMAAECTCHYVYIADSFGSIYGEQMRVLTRKYVAMLGQGSGAIVPKIIGIHGHNNQQLGFANSVEGVTEGIDMVDGSFLGMGRGSGNTCLEQLLCFFKNPKFDPRPVFDCIQKHFIPLRLAGTEWGVSIPYLIQGARNEHPKDAMAWEKAGKSDDAVGFFDKFMAGNEGDRPVHVPAKETDQGGDPDDVASMASPKPSGPRVPNLNSEIYRRDFFSYRPMIKVLDTTVRSGGFRNNWNLTDDFVKGIYTACIDGGIDYMEVGYLTGERAAAEASITREQFGPWRFCKESDLRRVFGDNKTSLKLAAMCDVGLITAEDIPHQRDTLINMLRVACCCDQIDEAIVIANAAVAKGLEAAVIISSISVEKMGRIEACLDKLAATCSAQTVYFDDTRGALYNEQVEMLTKLFMEKLPGRVVGFSGANNLQMSVANSVVAIIEGADMLDGSIMGLGRGCGTTPTENLLCFLKNPKFKLRPILVGLQEHVQPLTQADDTFFGVGVTGCPSLPYLVAGTRNDEIHDALAWCNAGKKHDGVGFLDFVRSKSMQFPTPKPKFLADQSERVPPRHAV